ncbi:MAG: hypothetical protein ACO1OO_07450 [Flavisolibacter sp.]
MKSGLTALFTILFNICFAQNRIDSTTIGDVKLTVDAPPAFANDTTMIIFYALPNGNTTAQTMGKRVQPGDDWHFDIQHIAAQTAFVRKQLPEKNIVVIYLENEQKSWPLWKQKHSENYKTLIREIVDSSMGIVPGRVKQVHLNGHSGGGSFIFGFLDGCSSIPSFVNRISFIDSNYGYEEKYYPLLKQWLKNVPGATLTVMAYNDSVALYQGKRIVSDTGGTWHRSHLMLHYLSHDFSLSIESNDEMMQAWNDERTIGIFLKENPDRGILHTQQVERNGFIHSILFGTTHENKQYCYYCERAYNHLIKD